MTNKETQREILCCIWYGEHADLDRLRAEKGVDVQSPGWWNTPGVDFVHADIRMNGRVLKTVGVTFSLDGYAPAEKPDVIVCAEDGGRTELDGIPVICLTPYINKDLAELVEWVGKQPDKP